MGSDLYGGYERLDHLIFETNHFILVGTYRFGGMCKARHFIFVGVDVGWDRPLDPYGADLCGEYV